MKSGVELIAEERAAQVSREGRTPEHDDEHTEGELASAAASYAIHAVMGSEASYESPVPPPWWPWDDEWWKPKNPMRDLVRAGALIAAEIDRRQRAEAAHASNERKQEG